MELLHSLDFVLFWIFFWTLLLIPCNNARIDYFQQRGPHICKCFRFFSFVLIIIAAHFGGNVLSLNSPYMLHSDHLTSRNQMWTNCWRHQQIHSTYIYTARMLSNNAIDTVTSCLSSWWTNRHAQPSNINAWIAYAFVWVWIGKNERKHCCISQTRTSGIKKNNIISNSISNRTVSALRKENKTDKTNANIQHTAKHNGRRSQNETGNNNIPERNWNEWIKIWFLDEQKRTRKEAKKKKLCQEQLSCTEITAEKVHVIRYHVVVVIGGSGGGGGGANIYKILQHFCYFHLISDISVANKSRHPNTAIITFGAHFIVAIYFASACKNQQM